MGERVREVEVLVAGGGGAGLAAALMLCDLGVDVLLVERHPSTAIAPKAHIINPRTVEAFLPYGFADDVYAKGSPLENFAKTRWYTSFGGDEVGDRVNFHTIDSWGGGHLREHYAPLSAFPHGNFQQNLLEPALRAHVDERRPGAALFHHELTAFEQDADGVTATILDRDAQETFQVRAQYLVGADGGKLIGRELGIGMVGGEPFCDAFSVHFHADLSPWMEHDDCVIKMVTRPTFEGEWVTAGLLAMGPDRWDRHAREWLLSIVRPVEEAASPDPSAETQLRLVRDALKIPDLDARILGSSHWLIESVIAERYREGRVFLVGDAAHRHSPMGGLGLNTGIQDAHNLTWKLAHVVQGIADPALLDSYEAERRPVGLRNVRFSTAAFFNHLATTSGFGLFPGAPPEFTRAVIESLNADTLDGRMRRARRDEYYATIRWEFECADVELGFEYADSPAVVPDGTAAPPRDPAGHVCVQAARPGHRLPHAYLEHDGERRSTHAFVRAGAFLLLAGARGGPWVQGARAAAAERGVELDAWSVGPGGDLADPDGAWAALRGHGEDGAVLVRPDGHVALRVPAADDPRQAVGRGLDVALGRTARALSAAT